MWSPSFGTVTWSAWFASLVELESFGDRLEADASYQDLAAHAAEHATGEIDDGLAQLVSGTYDPGRAVTHAGFVSAVAAGGQIERAMAAGIDIAETASGITGTNTLFLREMTGSYAGVGWLTGFEGIAEYEAAQDALASDPSWLKLIDSTEGAFAEDVSATQQTIHRQLV